MHEEDPSWLKDTLRSSQLKLRNNMENLSNSGVAPQCISLHLIEEFTNKFSDDRKIGDGTYGDVYKGILHNGKEIAVKMLRFVPGKDDQKQFKNEAENLMRLRHENIVQLIAYSYEVKHKFVKISESAAIDPRKRESERSMMVLAEEAYRALCFEYLQNGSLQKYLYDESNGLDWPTRYKIIKGTCEALKYLHEGLETPMLHLDLKPDNILLDKNMVPKLADFGLARLFTEEQTRALQQIAEQKKSQMSGVGTIGYVPPEYIEKNEYSEKFDIFSLGVIIIKIMSGEQGYRECNPMTSRDNDIDRVLGNWRGRLRARAAYTTLEEECHQVKMCIETALDCLQRDPMKRPKIGSIIQRLNETENKIEKLAISLPYNSRNDPGSDANMMPAPTEALIQVKPQQLCYRHPMEPNKNLASSLELKNLTNDHVAYMFVVSGEVEYSSARAKGIISPSSTWEVVLNMKAQNMSVLQHKNKVILRSTIVSKDLNPDDITLEMFKRTGRIVDEVKLDFVMEAPAPSQPPIQEKAGEQQPHQEVADHFKMLDVQPLELHFHFQRGKLVPCSFQLTNIKGEYVAFRLMEKSGESECFVQLPLQGILPPGSTHTLIVRTNMLQEQQQKRDCDLILQTCVLGYFDKDWLPFENESGCEKFFNLVKMWGGIVHEVAMKASQEKSSEILSSETTPGILYCFDTNPIKKWIITGYPSGSVDIVNYEKQMAVNSLQVSYKAVCVVKFIARKQYFVAGSFDGFLHVYDYGGTKLPNKKKSWEACDRSITSLAIHPTEPYVLSSGGNTIKLWNWEVGWKCEQTFKGHYDLVRQLVFNPSNTNIFASASDDKTIKVWKLYSSFPEYTLDGHSREATCLDFFSATCLDFFSSGYHQYLISGSNDKTAKIWDLQKKICVQTLDAFISSVTCVTAHPNLPMLITGSEDGILHIWKSTDFSLERVLNIGSGGYVRGIGFFMRSRIVIGQSDAISELSIDTMNYHEASLYLVDDETDQEETAPGDIAYEMGDVLIAGLMVGDFSDRLCVRASRTWDFFDIQDETKLLHSNLVLIDEEGNSIHAQIYPQLADKFKPLIKEGNVYNISFVKVKPSTTYKPVENDVKIIFTGWTTVEEVVEIPPAFPMFTYSLTPIEKLPSLANSREYLIDVIGAVTMISDASPFRRQLGRTVTICNASNASLEIVLWGERATSFPAEQVHKDGQDTPQVVIFVGTLVKSYAGDIYLSGGSSCKWYINPEIPEAESLKASIMNIYRPITLARQATKNEPKASTAEHKKISDIKYLHPFKNKKVEWLVTVSIMKIDKSWWYNSCKKCFKTAKPHGTTFRCGDPTCNNIGAPNPRYKLAFTAGDETGETEFVMFGRIAQRLIKRTVDTLIANNPAGFIPDEITCLLEKVFTFNVSFTENTIQSGNVSFQVNSVIAELDGGTSLPITPVGSQSSAAKPSQVAGSSVQVTPQEDTTLVLPSSATSSTTPSKSVVHNIELETTPQSNKSVEGNKETTGLATPPKRARQLLETLQDNENNPVSKVKPATTSSPMVPTCSTIETQKSTTKKRTRASPTKKTAKKLFRNEDVGSAGEAGSAGGGAESRNEDVGSAGEAGSAGGGAESRFGEDDT